MTTSIRRAGKFDIDTMISLLSELFFIETDFVIDAEKQREGLLHLLSDSDKCIIFLATNEMLDITGMVTAQLVVSTAAGGYGVLLEDMIVRKQYRGQGVGSLLLNAVRTWADDKGARRIQLLADRRNRGALSFYTGRGFSESFMSGLYLSISE